MVIEDWQFYAQMEHRSQVEESDGFEICGLGLMPVDCQRSLYAYPILTNLYAKLGLHRYNMMQGTSFELDNLVKYNMLANCVSSFYLTLVAKDPAAGDLEKTFQVRVDEQRFGRLDLTVSIARTKDEVTAKEAFIPHFNGGAVVDDDFFDGDELHDWPSDDALNDGNRFYEVKESEWQATGWISQYLEVVICSHKKSMSDRDILSRLEIVRVVIETRGIQDVNERLNAKSAYVYIWFKGLKEPFVPRQTFKIGEGLERKAIVRRVMDGTGCLTLLGKLCGGELRPLDDGQTSKTSTKRRGQISKTSTKRRGQTSKTSTKRRGQTSKTSTKRLRLG